MIHRANSHVLCEEKGFPITFSNQLVTPDYMEHTQFIIDRNFKFPVQRVHLDRVMRGTCNPI